MMRTTYGIAAFISSMILPLLAYSHAWADSGGLSSQVDVFVQAHMRTAHIPGMSIAVVKSGKVVYARGYGFADVDLSAPATAKTVYPIGSLSKQFTAAAILMLNQEGKLKVYDQFVAKLPNLRLPAAWSGITIRELLNQTSGIPAYTDFGPTDPSKDAMWKSWSAQQVIDLISSKPLAFEPGSRFQYSNSNYYLLAQVVLAVSGEDVYQFLRDRVFAPLNMDSTGRFDAEEIVPGRSSRYLLVGGAVINNPADIDPSYYVGAGGVESSVLDLAKWDAALYTESPLSDATKTAMWTAPTMSTAPAMQYGFGWVIDSVNGRRLIWHNGAIAGAMSWMGRYVDDKLTVILLCNVLNADSPDSQNLAMRAIGKGIAGIIDPALNPIAAAVGPGPNSASINAGQSAICKKAFTDILDGSADQTMYTADAAKVLFPDRIAQTTTLLKSRGAFEGIEAVDERSQPGSDIVTCRATFDSATLTYDFYLESGTNKIQGIMPKP